MIILDAFSKPGKTGWLAVPFSTRTITSSKLTVPSAFFSGVLSKNIERIQASVAPETGLTNPSSTKPAISPSLIRSTICPKDLLFKESASVEGVREPPPPALPPPPEPAINLSIKSLYR